MYVVIEWNQASRRPSLYGDALYDIEDEAREVAKQATKDRGVRRESYTVHEVENDWLWDSDEESA
jgi:hypothetical protein